MRRNVIFDLEADNLLRDATKIHCLCYRFEDEETIHVITSYADIRTFLGEDYNFIGHNIVMYDIPVVEKLLGTKFKGKYIDTLALTWYLYEERLKPGLESWGEEFGVPKPKIDDWENLSLEDYIYRCSEDVKINTKVWEVQKKFMEELYYDDTPTIYRLFEYFSFKLLCVRIQEEIGLRLDLDLTKSSLNKLEAEKEGPINRLKAVMPKVKIIAKAKKPTTVYKKDGTLSVAGEKWFDLLKEHCIPEDFEGVVEYIKGYKDPNPDSVSQKKDWLFSLGWEPIHFKYKDEIVNGTRIKRKIPQIGDKNDSSKICPSVLKLIDVEPEIEALAGLSTITHRIGIYKGFLENQIDGRIYASMNGFTSTFRLKHRVLVNLPSVYAPFAENVRRCLIADEGKVLIGTDLAGIEDRCKRHYIYPYDPDYVKKLSAEDYDPHLDISIMAGLITEEDSDFYKEYDKRKSQGDKDFCQEHKARYDDIKQKRHKGKTTNFSCIYGIGADALAIALGITRNEAQNLIDAYWKLNWAVKQFTEDLPTRRVQNKLFVLNPITKFWMPLRAEKDKFSAVNQSSGVYVLDLYIGFMMQKGILGAFQTHDEELFNSDDVERDIAATDWAIGKVNKVLKLNVELGKSVDVGPNYAECH